MNDETVYSDGEHDYCHYDCHDPKECEAPQGTTKGVCAL